MQLDRKPSAVARVVRLARPGGASRGAREPSRRGVPDLARGVGALVAALLAIAASGCHPSIQGNGVLREEDRTSTLSPFVGVQVEDGIETDVAVGEPLRVVVSGDENVVPYVETKVETDATEGIPVLVARVSYLSGYTARNPLRLTVSVPDLRLARAVGKTRIAASEVAAEALRVEGGEGSTLLLSGAGTGASPALDVVLAGARLDARHYVVATASVALTGEALAQLDATQAVTGTAVPPGRVENSAPGAGCDVYDGSGNRVSCAPSP